MDAATAVILAIVGLIGVVGICFLAAFGLVLFVLILAGYGHF